MTVGLVARVPPVSLRWYGPGDHCPDSVAGDALLVDHGSEPDRAIRFGQRLLSLSDPELRGYSWCTHAALVRAGGADAEISEMSFRGYRRRGLEDYRHRLYVVAHFGVDEELRAAVVANDDACSGIGYDWVSYLPLILDGLTGARFAGSWGSTMICSTHVTLCEMACGLFPHKQPGGVTPADLARYVRASPPALGAR